MYRECSIDYDKNSPTTKKFYATVQNKLHWAIHHHTAAELIMERADASKPNMGLTSYKNSNTTGKVLKSDTEVAKNYLTQEEISSLNRLVSMYLDFAENMAKRNKAMTMEDWRDRLDAFLQFNEYEILQDLGKVSSKVAKKTAHKEYEKFRVIQDKDYKSDFEETINVIKETGRIPRSAYSSLSIKGYMERVNRIKEKEQENLSEFNKKLKKGLDFNPKENN